jgi:ribonucleoside-triphosphate reductase
MDEKEPSPTYSSKVLDAHKNGDIFIHNLNKPGKGYSAGWSLEQIEEKYHPSNLDEFFEAILQHDIKVRKEWLGPQAYNRFDTCALKYGKTQIESYSKLVKGLQDFSAFSMDLEERSNAFHKNLLGSIKSAILGNLFNFIPVLNIREKTNWKNQALQKYIAHAFKFGNVHFHNYYTGTITYGQLIEKPRKTEPDVIHLRQGGVVGNSDGRGVIGIVTINLPRLGYLSKSEEEFFKKLENTLEIAFHASEEKRRKMEKMLEQNKMHETLEYINTLDWFYSVINLSGMNEALKHTINAGVAHVAGKAVTYKVLEKILWKVEDFQRESGNLYSFEALPSEKQGVIFAKKDKEKLPDIMDNEVSSYYTDSTNLPLDHGDDLWDALEHQKKYHSIYTGGTLFQVRLVEMIRFQKECVLLIRKILEEFGYNYLTISPTFSICNNHGYIKGQADQCNLCKDKISTITWVDGLIHQVEKLSKEFKEADKKRVYHTIKSS